MKYRMIDKRTRNSREELKEYTLEELKAYFTIEDDEISNVEEMAKVQDIDDLVDLLEREAAGMEQPYIFEEVNWKRGGLLWVNTRLKRV